MSKKAHAQNDIFFEDKKVIENFDTLAILDYVAYREQESLEESIEFERKTFFS